MEGVALFPAKSSRAPTYRGHRNSRHISWKVRSTRKVQTAEPPSVISASLATRRPTIRVARATFRPARLAFRAVRRTARRAFRIAFRPARRILRASRRPVRRDCRADRRPARLVRRVARLACLFLRGMFSSLTTMCQCASLPAASVTANVTDWDRTHTINSRESYAE